MSDYTPQEQENIVKSFQKNPAYGLPEEMPVEDQHEQDEQELLEEEQESIGNISVVDSPEILSQTAEMEKLMSERQRISKGMFHQPSPRHSVTRLRGVGFTRKNKSETKKARKLAKIRRARNRRK